MVDPDVRAMAISILYSYLSNGSIMILRETLRVSAGSRSYVKFDYSYPFIYELTVSVSGNCIGKCDIEIRLLDEGYRTIRFLGRVSYLRENLTILLALGAFYRYLSVDTT